MLTATLISFDYAQQGLKQKFPEAFLDPKIRPLLEFDWHTYLCNKKRVSRLVIFTWNHTCPECKDQSCCPFRTGEVWWMLWLCIVFYTQSTSVWSEILLKWINASKTTPLQVDVLHSKMNLMVSYFTPTQVFSITVADETFSQVTARPYAGKHMMLSWCTKKKREKH